jgi:hypothetical protein
MTMLSWLASYLLTLGEGSSCLNQCGHVSGDVEAHSLFDADLDRACRKPGCTLCHLIREHDQHAMHSFLWEYCTDPHIGRNISQSWGFCPSHTWSLAVLEHECMGDGLGITNVYQALFGQLRRSLASRHQAGKQSIPPLQCFQTRAR